MSINVSEITKTYSTQKAVNNLSFSIQPGEIVGFLGPNGAGKSTTMKMITGFLLPDRGCVHVCNIDVAKNPIEVKRKIGYLSESNPLYFDMYIKEYLDFISGIHQIDNKNKKIKEVIELTGLHVEQNKKIGQLSKGYKQRTGLAAALIHNPEVLILDEPTSGLDPNQIIEIRDVIKQQGQNKTVLFSSHILQEVEAICDRVIIINKGSMVADERLLDLQNKGNRNNLTLTFKEKLPLDFFNEFREIAHIKRINEVSWQISSDDLNLVKKQILEHCLQLNLNIVSLQNENTNLEEIFRDLTGSNAMAQTSSKPI